MVNRETYHTDSELERIGYSEYFMQSFVAQIDIRALSNIEPTGHLSCSSFSIQACVKIVHTHRHQVVLTSKLYRHLILQTTFGLTAKGFHSHTTLYNRNLNLINNLYN